jgi:hypothetical protein
MVSIILIVVLVIPRVDDQTRQTRIIPEEIGAVMERYRFHRAKQTIPA